MITAIDRGERAAAPQAADCSQDTKILPANRHRQQQQHQRFKHARARFPQRADQPQRPRINRSTTRLNEISVKHESQQVKLRTRRLTVCLFLLVGSISSLTPFLTLHLTNRVGLLLFESDLLQLRSSLISVIICFTFLVILDLIIVLLSKTRFNSNSTQSSISYLFALDKRRSLLLQKLLKQCIGLLAITSVLAYLSLALIVPHIKQLQRTPFATFDCNANLITIENCQQQFSTNTGENSLLDSVQQLIVGDLNGNGGRLAKRLECLKYNDESLEHLRVPTRFLLSKCGLICEPQRQQLHQFGDDLNSNPSSTRKLVAPYSQLDFETESPANNSQSSGDDNPPLGADGQLVSLKLCFSGEINGGEGSGGSNYMRFCVENLTSGDGKSHQSGYDSGFLRHPKRDQTLTVGQLNAILSHRQQSSQQGHQAMASLDPMAGALSPSGRGDQSTHYVNPIVQFESHFKNWPHLTRASTAFTSNEGAGYGFSSEKPSENDSAGNTRGAWCKFKPMPPFIVNNKPFSDIHCSLEHDYLMSTGSPLLEQASQQRRRRSRRRRRSSAPKIYLRKSDSPVSEFGHSERCNIGCQVNILYQTRHEDNGDKVIKASKLAPRGDRLSNSSPTASYYLPLKSCLIVRGDKDRTSQYYLWFRATADASLLLTFILVDILLMIESIDTKEFQLEGKKVRLLGLLLAITLLPLLVASLFDLAASWLPMTSTVGTSTPGRSEGQLIQFINDRLIPSMSETFAKLEAYLKPPKKQQPQRLHSTPHDSHDLNSSTLADHVTRERTTQDDLIIVDNYLVPFFIYAVLMFAFAINSFKLPLVASTSPLVRVTSTEELGMVNSTAVKTTTPSHLINSTRRISGGKTKSLDVLSEPSRAQTLPARNPELAQKLAPFSRGAKQPSSRTEKPSSQSKKSSARPVVLFAMLTLFMGLQFNLSQITQTQILIETFNIQNDLTQQQYSQQQAHHHYHQQQQHYERPGKVAISFVLVANSCGTIFILILALLFSDELSIFLGQLFPFKPVVKGGDENDLSLREHSMRFKKFISVSLVVYALRYFVLANMTAQMSKMKWFLAILFQSTELLNFPLTWFELASRAHEILLVKQSEVDRKRKSLDISETTSNHDNREQARPTSSNIHLLIQSTLAFVYFALARLLALFVHSLHASLYLHSDNVDWFIESFYGASGNGNGNAMRSETKQGKPMMKQAPPVNHTTPQMDSLFIPLPSERQTYLHASRSFIRYNSLVCLMVALGFLLVFSYERYRLWIEQKRLALIQRQRSPLSERDSDLIDERLSLDLFQIHSQPEDSRLHRHRSETTVFTHLPRSSLARRYRADDSAVVATDEEESERPRARIHFRYDLGLHRNVSSSDSTSSSSGSSSAGAYYPGGRARRPKTSSGDAARPMGGSRIIPMILEEDTNEAGEDHQTQGVGGQQEQMVSSTEEEVEQFTKTRSARMLVEDEEEWSLDGEVDEHERQATTTPASGNTTTSRRFVDSALAAAACSPPPPGFADDNDDERHRAQNASALDLDPPPEFDESSSPNQRSNRARVQHITRTPLLASEQAQKRRITFGPTTTFFSRSGGGSGESGDQYSSASSTTMATTPSANAQRPERQHSDITSRDNRWAARGQRHLQTSRALVSPEPSIDDDDDDFECENHSGQTTEDNNYWRETSLRASSVSRTMTQTSGSRTSRRSNSRRSANDEMDSID